MGFQKQLVEYLCISFLVGLGVSHKGVCAGDTYLCKPEA